MLTSAYTIEGWVKRTGNSQDGWIGESKQSGSGDKGLLFTGGNVQSRCKNVAGTVFTVQTTQPTAGTAYHFACTNDGTTLRLYINGTQVGTGTAFSGGVRTNSTTIHLLDGLGSETWIDDLRFYDVALSQAQIAADMAAPVTSGASMTLDQATGTGSAQALSASKDLALGAAAGTGAAQALAPSKQLTLGAAADTGAPQAMTFSKAWTLSAATGSGAPAAIADSKSLTLGTAAGAGSPQGLAPGKDLGLQAATGTGAAQAASFGAAGSMALGPAAGIGQPQAMTFSKAWTLGAAGGSGAAQQLTAGKAWTLGAAAGSGSPRALVAGKGLVFGTAQGVGTAFALGLTGPLPDYSAPDEWDVSTRPGALATVRAQSTNVRTRVHTYTAVTRED
jgi:hypothetical protein